MAEQRSPLQLALGRFARMRSARIGMLVTGVMVLVGIYAPFLANDSALVWIDGDGWSLPAITELFNRKRFGNRHDLFFNLAIFVLPLAIIAGIFLRKRYGLGTIVRSALLLLAVVWVAFQIPLVPTADGLKPLWRERTESTADYETWLAIADLNRRADASEDELIDHLRVEDLVRDGDGTMWRVAEIMRNSAGEPSGIYGIPAIGGTGHELPASALQVPPQPTGLFPPVPHTESRNYRGGRFAAPGSINPVTERIYRLGADATGRDILSRMIHGTRIALVIGLFATGLAMSIGIVIGATSGYFGGWVDIILQRLVEIMLAFPSLLLVLIVVAMLDRNIFVIMTVIGLTDWASTARLVRGEFFGQTEREYVLAAQTLGLQRWRIMFRHILPNILTPLFIGATFSIAGAVLTESSLAFIGLGDDGVPSWGGILADGRRTPQNWWMIYTPGIAIFLLVSSLNLIGNALREALDPRNADR